MAGTSRSAYLKTPADAECPDTDYGDLREQDRGVAPTRVRSARRYGHGPDRRTRGEPQDRVHQPSVTGR